MYFAHPDFRLTETIQHKFFNKIPFYIYKLYNAYLGSW